MRLPIIGEVDYVILGGRIEALQEAFRLSESGKNVAVVSTGTYLAEDICDTERYFLTETWNGIAELPKELFFENGMLHPDRLKRYLETLCKKMGIRLFYFMKKIDIQKWESKTLVRLASKGGAFGLICQEVKDFSRKSPDISYQVFVREETDSQWSLMTVDGVGDKSAGRTQNIFRCREAVLQKFAEEKKRRPGLCLGRFAVRGYEPEQLAEIGKSAAMQDADCRKDCCCDVKVRWDSEVLRLEKYPYIDVSEHWNMERKTYDLVVAGGGTAGVMAAIHAARRGVKTVLVEPNHELGGTGTVGGVTTYWFGKRFRDVEEIDKEVYQVSESLGIKRAPGVWSQYDDFHGGVRAQVYLRKCLEAGVDVVFGQIAWGAVMEEGRILAIATSGEEGNVAYYGNIILDATGDGDIAVAAGADSIYGNERDCTAYWPSLAHYISGDKYINNFAGALLLSSDPEDYTKFIINARKRGENLFDHGSYLAMRESRHVRGKSVLTLKELMTGQTYEDGLYTCYSNYDPKGLSTSDLAYAGILPPQAAIQIPLSALEPVNREGERIQNLYVLGKAISASHNIFPSIRMQPDLMHQGSVMGELAAYCLTKGVRPEEVSHEEIRRLVSETTGDDLELPCWKLSPALMAERITDKTRRNWIDVPFLYEEKEQNELVTVMCARSEEVLPGIRERLKNEQREEIRKALIECALWHGADDWTEEYCLMIWKELELAREDLPLRKSESYQCVVKILPDHGVMPETVNSLNLLAWSRKACVVELFEEVFKRLCSRDRDYSDNRKGIFHYVEAFGYAAERTGRKEFIPMLVGILQFSELQEVMAKKEESELMTDRFRILVLELFRALAALGDVRGYQGLIQLLDVGNASVEYSASRVLNQLTGAYHGCDQKQWKEEIQRNTALGKVQKITEKCW